MTVHFFIYEIIVLKKKGFIMIPDIECIYYFEVVVKSVNAMRWAGERKEESFSFKHLLTLKIEIIKWRWCYCLLRVCVIKPQPILLGWRITCVTTNNGVICSLLFPWWPLCGCTFSQSLYLFYGRICNCCVINYWQRSIENKHQCLSLFQHWSSHVSGSKPKTLHQMSLNASQEFIEQPNGTC